MMLDVGAAILLRMAGVKAELGSDAHHDLGVSVGNGEGVESSGSGDAPKSASGYSNLSKSDGPCDDGVAMRLAGVKPNSDAMRIMIAA